jgi:hypothetical protein
MRRLAGLFFFTAGIAFAVFAFLPQPHDRDQILSQITAIASAPPGYFDGTDNQGGLGPARSFSPKFPLVSSRPLPAKQTARVETTAAVLPPAGETSAWNTFVAPDPSTVPAGARLTSSKPGDGDTRYELVLSLQRDLKRAGCYGGTLNGSWTVSTRKAMVAFMESVNASLPVNEPDYILQTLLKGHAGASCGSECPKGLMRSDDGRCLARSVIAEAPRPAAAAEGNTKSPARPSSPSANPTGFTTTVRVAHANPYPPRPSAATTSTSNLALPDAVSALPGRMSVGAAPPNKTSRDAPWRISIISSPGPAAQTTGRRTEPQSAETHVAALPADERAEPGQEISALDDSEVDPGSEALAVPRENLPGASSDGGQAGVRTAALVPAPTPDAAAALRNRRAYLAPRPNKPVRANSKRRLGYQTRSVRAVFRNPFGW